MAGSITGGLLSGISRARRESDRRDYTELVRIGERHAKAHVELQLHKTDHSETAEVTASAADRMVNLAPFLTSWTSESRLLLRLERIPSDGGLPQGISYDSWMRQPERVRRLVTAAGLVIAPRNQSEQARLTTLGSELARRVKTVRRDGTDFDDRGNSEDYLGVPF